MVSLDVASNCNCNPRGLSGWVAMINLQTAGERYTCELEGRRLSTFARCKNLTTRDKETTSPRMTFQSPKQVAGGFPVQRDFIDGSSNKRQLRHRAAQPRPHSVQTKSNALHGT